MFKVFNAHATIRMSSWRWCGYISLLCTLMWYTGKVIDGHTHVRRFGLDRTRRREMIFLRSCTLEGKRKQQSIQSLWFVQQRLLIYFNQPPRTNEYIFNIILNIYIYKLRHHTYITTSQHQQRNQHKKY